MREHGLEAFVYLVMVSVRRPAQLQGKPPDAKRRTPHNFIQTFFLVGPGLSTVIALRVTERQPGGNCRVGKALLQLAREGSP